MAYCIFFANFTVQREYLDGRVLRKGEKEKGGALEWKKAF